jgi:hypothetical protein
MKPCRILLLWNAEFVVCAEFTFSQILAEFAFFLADILAECAILAF